MAEVVTTDIVKVVTIDYFVHASIKAFTAENIGVDMRLKLYLEEKWWRSFVENW